MKKRVHLLISGMVQGVNFRNYCRREALRYDAHGWVRNLDDGRVEVTAEAEETALTSFVEWCRHGPPYSSVTDMETTYSDATGEFTSFDITF